MGKLFSASGSTFSSERLTNKDIATNPANKTPAKPMPFEQAKPVIRRQLEKQAAQKYLSKLVASADIKNFVTFKEVKKMPAKVN